MQVRGANLHDRPVVPIGVPGSDLKQRIRCSATTTTTTTTCTTATNMTIDIKDNRVRYWIRVSLVKWSISVLCFCGVSDVAGSLCPAIWLSRKFALLTIFADNIFRSREVAKQDQASLCSVTCCRISRHLYDLLFLDSNQYLLHLSLKEKNQVDPPNSN